MDVNAVLKMHADAEAASNKLAEELRAKVEKLFEELRILGFDYEYLTRRQPEVKKLGRPKKEVNGVVQQTAKTA